MERRVLVVDDEPALRSALMCMVETLGAKALAAASGEEALEQMETGAFSLIILDRSLPGISGIETASRIWSREESNTTPILFLSGSPEGEEEARRAAAAAGGAPFLYMVKPVAPDRLMATVMTALETGTN